MRLIDANIFIYSRGRKHPLKRPSNQILERMRRSSSDGNVSTEILQEVLNYYHRKGQTAVGLRIFDDLMKQFPEPYPITRSTAISARDILARHPSIQTRDAFHVAVVFENKLEGIISADSGLDVIHNLVRFDPKELAA